MPIVPLYEIYKQDEEQLHILQAHVRKSKPYARMLEDLCVLYHTHLRESRSQISLAPLEERMQTLYQKATKPFTQKEEIPKILLDTTENLLETAIYLGFDQAFCTLILIQLIFFIGQQHLDLSLYEFGSNYRCGDDKNLQISWKEFPLHPFLNQCLHKDSDMKLRDHPDINTQMGRFFIPSLSISRDIFNAIQAGNIRFVEMLQHGLRPDHGEFCEHAASHEQLEMLKWLRRHGCLWCTKTCSDAARNGHFDILAWLKEQNCPWDEWTCARAAGGGHIELLIWLREQGCPWDEFSCDEAASHGHLEILKWAKRQGCPWDEYTCASAAKKGHLIILKWLREQGCPWNEATWRAASQNKHSDVLEWLEQQNCPKDLEDTIWRFSDTWRFSDFFQECEIEFIRAIGKTLRTNV